MPGVGFRRHWCYRFSSCLRAARAARGSGASRPPGRALRALRSGGRFAPPPPPSPPPLPPHPPRFASPMVSWGLLAPLGASWGLLGLPETSWGLLGPLGTPPEGGQSPNLAQEPSGPDFWVSDPPPKSAPGWPWRRGLEPVWARSRPEGLWRPFRALPGDEFRPSRMAVLG